MELVTGRAGSPHITAQQDRQKHQGIWGDGAYILATGNQLEPQVQSSNKILIKDGALMFQGALFSVKVGTTDEITINNGNQGMQRKDLVVARYTYDSAQQIESAEWVVIQGEPAASNPVAPSGTSGDIQTGDTTVDCPFMIVNLDGINVTGVDIIPEVASDIPTINASLSYLAKITEGEITPYTDRETVFGSSLKRQGNMVELLLNVGTTASIAVGHRLADISAEYAPPENIIVSATYYGNTYAISINSNGTVTNVSSGAIPTGETLRIHETYFVN